MILARNSFLKPWGICRHKGHCRHQPCQRVAPLPSSCFSHISTELKITGRILQELLSPRLGSKGICYKNNRVKNLPAPWIVVPSPAEGALLEHLMHSSSRTLAQLLPAQGPLTTRSLALVWGQRAGDKAAHTKQSRQQQDAEGQMPLTSAIRNMASVAHHRSEGHLQEIPVSVTQM